MPQFGHAPAIQVRGLLLQAQLHVNVIATPMAHPNDSAFGPILYTAGLSLTGPFTRNKNGNGLECPAGFQDAAVVDRVEAGGGLTVPPRGLLRGLRLSFADR
jgi:hypothetical protein